MEICVAWFSVCHFGGESVVSVNWRCIRYDTITTHTTTFKANGVGVVDRPYFDVPHAAAHRRSAVVSSQFDYTARGANGAVLAG